MRSTFLALSVFLSFAGIGDQKHFLRVSPDRALIEIGATAETERAGGIQFVIAQTEAERWPAAVTVTVRDTATSDSWEIPLESRFVLKRHAIRAPRGAYDVALAAPHYRPLHRTVTLAERDVDLGTLTLQRYPAVSGVIQTSSGSPVAGALITDRGSFSAKSNAVGSFAADVEGEWPSEIEVSFPGLAATMVTLPKTQTSIRLPPIVMSKASRLAIAIAGATDDVDVDLAKESSSGRMTVLRQRHATVAEPRVLFDDIGKGDYLVMLRGRGPLQRLIAPVSVNEFESVSRDLRIQPVAADIRARRGEAPLPGAAVTAISEGNRWSSDMKTDAEGRIETEAWQPGHYAFAIVAHADAPPVILEADLEGTVGSTVVLELPDRSIQGRVVDADDGSPLPKAELQVESKNDDGTAGTQTVIARPDGSFSMDDLRDGTYTLNVVADTHIYSDPMPVRVDNNTPRPAVVLRVRRGEPRPLRVRWQNGTPVPRATVIEMINDAVAGIRTTDEAGAVTLRAARGSSMVVYVLPLEGSFAITRFGFEPPEGESLITVREGSATVELHATDAAGKPIPRLRFVMRYDGEIIPPDVVDVLEMRRGMMFTTGADGVARIERLPVGFVELWPTRARNSSASTAVQLPVKDGLNVVSMTFTLDR